MTKDLGFPQRRKSQQNLRNFDFSSEHAEFFILPRNCRNRHFSVENHGMCLKTLIAQLSS